MAGGLCGIGNPGVLRYLRRLHRPERVGHSGGSVIAADSAQPLRLDRRFDLVVTLEVAEHLPKTDASTFVQSLTELGPVVLFSAAIPFQGGENHLNEQWPDYWAHLFHNRGYRAVDCLRKKTWHNDKVEPWYAQNILLFVHPDEIASSPRLCQLNQREAEIR